MSDKNQDKMGLIGLITLIMTTIIGSGIFNLTKEMAGVASVKAVMLGWIITGIGMGALALSMQGVSRLRPDLDSGIFSYALEGFGAYIGFNSAWGYWVSNLIKNAAYGTLMFSALSYFFPVFGQGQNLPSLIGASCVLWGIHFLVLQGNKSLNLLNITILIAKLSPIILFVLVTGLAFNSELFAQDFWSRLSTNVSLGPTNSQVKDTMLVTVFSFIGLESAVAFSGKARKQADVGRSTMIAFSAVTLIYALVTILAYGIMTREELASLPNPAMAYILEKLIGPFGATFVNIGIIISIFGAWFSSTLLGEEVVYQSAHQGLFPAIFDKRNDKLVSVTSLTLSTVCIQVLFLTFLVIPNAYSYLTKLSSATILLSYACIACFYIKLLRNNKDKASNGKGILVAVLAADYMVWLIYASGPKFMMLTILTLFPGTLVYAYLRRRKDLTIFNRLEWVLMGLMAIGFVYSLGQLSVLFK